MKNCRWLSELKKKITRFVEPREEMLKWLIALNTHVVFLLVISISASTFARFCFSHFQSNQVNENWRVDQSYALVFVLFSSFYFIGCQNANGIYSQCLSITTIKWPIKMCRKKCEREKHRFAIISCAVAIANWNLTVSNINQCTWSLCRFVVDCDACTAFSLWSTGSFATIPDRNKKNNNKKLNLKSRSRGKKKHRIKCVARNVMSAEKRKKEN